MPEGAPHSNHGSRYPAFDRSRLELKPLAERRHDLHLDRWLALGDPTPPFSHPALEAVAGRLAAARASGAARILMMGAHVLRAGVNRHLIDLLERGRHRPHRHERRRRHSRLRAGAHRRHHRERRPLHPHRRVRTVARNRRVERLDPAKRPPSRWGWARTSDGASGKATSRTAIFPCSPPPTACGCPLRSTRESVTTSSTSIPTATARRWAPPVTATS